MEDKRISPSVHTYYANKGFGETLMLYISLTLAVISGVKVFFLSGGEYGRMEQHLSSIDGRLDKGELEWARKPEVDLKLSMIDKHQDLEDSTLKELAVKIETQNHLLDQIEVKLELEGEMKGRK
jgi:hypothetical protein